MCYAIPGRVVELKGNVAVVDYFGEHRNVLHEFKDAKVGEYVYAQGGIIVQRIPEKEALLILEEWKDIFFQLKEVDLKLSNLLPEKKGLDPKLAKILEKVSKNQAPAKEELLHILNVEDEEGKNYIFRTANFIRQKNLSNSCCIHGIIEFSNYCQSECQYCGISKFNKRIERYRMSIDEILACVDEATKLGFKALVLQSGEDMYFTTSMMEDLIKRIRDKFAK